LKVEVPVDEAVSRKILGKYRKDLEELKALTKDIGIFKCA